MALKRHHYVFVRSCGCPGGVVDAGSVRSEDAAWNDMYPTRAEQRAAVAAGITVRHVDYPTYERDWHPLMLARCPHI